MEHWGHLNWVWGNQHGLGEKIWYISFILYYKKIKYGEIYQIFHLYKTLKYNLF